MIKFDYDNLLYAVILSGLVTIFLKTGPISIFKGDVFPPMFRRWLDFVPVAVMGSIVGPDIFIYNGVLDISFSNLFLLVSIPTFAVALFSKNYFVTIATGIALVILVRFYGFT